MIFDRFFVAKIETFYSNWTLEWNIKKWWKKEIKVIINCGVDEKRKLIERCPLSPPLATTNSFPLVSGFSVSIFLPVDFAHSRPLSGDYWVGMWNASAKLVSGCWGSGSQPKLVPKMCLMACHGILEKGLWAKLEKALLGWRGVMRRNENPLI